MTSEEFKQEAQALRPQLISLAKRYLKDTDEAEDVVQDALLKLWQMHGELRSPMAAMAATITRNLSIDRLRRQHRTEPIGQLLKMSRKPMNGRNASSPSSKRCQQCNKPSCGCDIWKKWK